MHKNVHKHSRGKTVEQVLTQEIEETLLLAVASPGELPPKRVNALRERIMARIDLAKPLVTIHAAEGKWINVLPKVKSKMLFNNGKKVAQLFRLEAGGEIPAHPHPVDEECMVLEGEAWIGDIHVKAGDFHFAPRGTPHGKLHSPTGALLYIRTGA
jgi:quercetin dioxygenase-like cupin family protein